METSICLPISHKFTLYRDEDGNDDCEIEDEIKYNRDGFHEVELQMASVCLFSLFTDGYGEGTKTRMSLSVPI